MAGHLIPLADELSSGELGSLVGSPLHDNADQADLCLSADDWFALLARRRKVGWPLHFIEALTHA